MRPGDEVECIKDMPPTWHRRNALYWHVTPPVVGQRYTVRALCPVSRDQPRIILVGLKNPRVRFYYGVTGEASFPVKNFRKLTRTATTVEQWLAKPTDADSEQWDNRREPKDAPRKIKERV